MGIYLIIYATLFIVGSFSFIIKKDSKILFNILFIIMAIILCFRYGQGTDYFAYRYLYISSPTMLNFNNIYYNSNYYHGEIGWKIINNICHSLGMPYELFICILSIIELICIYRFIMLYCREYKCIALLLIYPTLYLTYMFSVIRQGLVICIFLGILLKLLIEKKYFKYSFIVLFLCSIHSATLLLLACPIIISFSNRTVYKCIGFLSIIGICISFGFGRRIFNLFLNIGFLETYLTNTNISYLPLLERILMALIILYSYMIYKKNYSYKNEQSLEIIMKLYMFGVGIYMLFFWSDIIASRLCYVFKPLEICLLIKMIFSLEKFRTLLIIIVLCLCTLMFVKNTDSYIKQGDYYEDKWYKYPYVSIFNKEKINDVRVPDEYMLIS